MTGDMREVAAETAERLRAVLESIDAGELEAEPGQRAYLEGAMDALEALAAGVDPTRFTENDRLP
ncbi:hypothetical protein Q5530_05555 [Saccharothrix sp. BKS2]|uniref:hypothetical protein n=1 Tax=Saccharothrix sp. BKS2 TaxID=3064400 RepID=UPI0039E85F2F